MRMQYKDIIWINPFKGLNIYVLFLNIEITLDIIFLKFYYELPKDQTLKPIFFNASISKQFLESKIHEGFLITSKIFS